MPEAHFLQDLAVVMLAAAAMTFLCHLLKQPPVIGYLAAGLIIGPHTPPFAFIQDLKSIHTLAELGLVFLMFFLGLEFSIPKLRRAGFPAALAAFLEIAAMLWVGYQMGQFFGWSRLDSIFLGAILSISSTTIIVKVLTDLKLAKEEFAQAVFGILILEDIAAVLLISVLSGLQKGAAALPEAARALFGIFIFIILFLVLGLLLIPRLIHWISKFKNPELTGIVTLGICLGGALLATRFGFSVALGAFLAGAIIAASAHAELIEDWMRPLEGMFSAIFFVATGMLLDPAAIWEYRLPILAVTAATLAGKIISGSAGAFLAGYTLKTSVKTGMSRSQIGEFSFVIAGLAAASQTGGHFLYPIAVAVSTITAFCTPYLIQRSDSTVDWFLRLLPDSIREWLERYPVWIQNVKNSRSNESIILARYLLKLIIYGALFFGLLLSIEFLARYISHDWQFLFWTGALLASYPLCMAFTRYSNHFVLLLLLRGTQEEASSRLLKYINIGLFYSFLSAVTLLILSLLFLLFASAWLESTWNTFASGACAGGCAWVLRRQFGRLKEWIESLLDDVLGLAASDRERPEPPL